MAPSLKSQLAPNGRKPKTARPPFRSLREVEVAVLLNSFSTSVGVMNLSWIPTSVEINSRVYTSFWTQSERPTATAAATTTTGRRLTDRRPKLEHVVAERVPERDHLSLLAPIENVSLVFSSVLTTLLISFIRSPCARRAWLTRVFLLEYLRSVSENFF